MNNNCCERINALTDCLWHYLRLAQDIQSADCIIVMGSHDLGAVPRVVELLQQAYSDLVVFSGGYGKVTQHLWAKPEAEIFAQLALNLGVPATHMLLETQASNCGENVKFSMQLLAEKGIKPSKVILVCKPYLERRALATFKQHFPEVTVWVTSQNIRLNDYLVAHGNSEQVINLMVGDVQRILLYPAKGFQIKQDVPIAVRLAYEELINLGYDQQLI